MTPEQFIQKWSAVSLSERSAAQQHFLDVCPLIGEPTPAAADPTGETFTFEKGARRPPAAMVGPTCGKRVPSHGNTKGQERI
jgi:hypothetical protein